jgi:hypothetical protein
MTAPAADELFRFLDIAYDVGLNFGSTTDQGLDRAKRCLNRAATQLAGHDRRWSWLRVKDSILTVQGEPEYSLPPDFRKEEQFWIQEGSRRKLGRISTALKTELVPDAELRTGIPSLYDFEGVDSVGSRVATFWPCPSEDDIEIWFRYSRFILPIRDDQKSLRASWGMPPNIIEVLVQKASALAIQGINSDKYFALNNAADAQIAEAYAADQSHPDATYQARLVGEGRPAQEGPLLPPEYG